MRALKIKAEWKPKEGHFNERDIPQTGRVQEGNKVLYNPKVEIVTIGLPNLGPTEVLIKVKYTGICGSDILMNWPGEDGYTRYPYIMKAGVTIGHEFSGIIESRGIDVDKYASHLKIGTPVTAQCVVNCGYCKSCQEGNFDDCKNNEERGFSVDGSMADFVKVDIRHVYSLETLTNNYSDGSA